MKIKHGEARDGKRTKEYTAWAGMIDRCTVHNRRSYPRYGGRGITVCDRWRHSFENFLSDMGRSPVGMSLERKDNDGNYEPSNCKWASDVEQRNNSCTNKWVSFRGKTLTVAQWAREIGMDYGTLQRRIWGKWNVERALTEPVDVKMRNSLAKN